MLCRTTESFAITDAQPEVDGTPRQIKICPKYFTDATTKLSTNSKEYKVNPGRRDNSWCQPGNKFKDFSVGGITLLHEMTHLDALAAAADYPDVHDDDGDFDTHATEDVAGVNPQNNPPLQSRNLAQIWQQGKEGDYDNLVEPYRNAESIADAAFGEWRQAIITTCAQESDTNFFSEAYVMKFCELDNIDI